METKNKNRAYEIIIVILLSIIAFGAYSVKGAYMKGRLSGLQQYKEAVLLYMDKFNSSVDVAKIDSNLPEKLTEIMREHEKYQPEENR